MNSKHKRSAPPEPKARERALSSTGRCLCGAVTVEIDVPVRWAWHDHSEKSRRAHGAAYATYVGAWRSRCRVTEGEGLIATFEDESGRARRSFCKRCGTPLMYERSHAPQMVNVPRALFAGRTGREPRYHAGIDEMPEWTYLGARLVPLKSFPGIVWDRSRRKGRGPTD